MGRTIAVLWNPTAANGRSRRRSAELRRVLGEQPFDTRIITADSAEAALGLAHEAVADGVDALVAAGGDGTVHLALQAVAGTGTALGILPIGTGNDNAGHIGLNDSLLDSVRCLTDFRTREVDAAHVVTDSGVERWFMGVMSCGFDSAVTERANAMRWPKGDIRYILATIGTLHRFHPAQYRVTIDGRKLTGTGMLVAIGNAPCYGGGMQVCVGSRIDDGRLTMTWMGESSKTKLLRMFPTIYRGTHVNDPVVRQFTGNNIRIEASGQIAYADGELVGPLPAEVSVHPGALTVVAPAAPPGP